MEGGLLSLKWNNHRSTFLHVLSTVRRKESYCDVTLACDGKFYPVHKLVLSTCSEYFEQMFERTNCKHPIIVLKDIKKEDLEALLNYMYLGEVNVMQNNLSGLIKAAENLRIKGLAVPDESPSDGEVTHEGRRMVPCGGDVPDAKRRRTDDISQVHPRPSQSPVDSNKGSGGERSPLGYRDTFRIPLRTRETARSAGSSPLPAVPPSPESLHPAPPVGVAESPSDLSVTHPQEQVTDPQAPTSEPTSNSSRESGGAPDHELKVDETLVKEEPQDSYGEHDETKDTLQSRGSDAGLNYSQQQQHSSGGGVVTEGHHPPSLRPPNVPQTLEDLVALPGASGLQSKSLWESDRGLQAVPFEGYSSNQPRASQMGPRARCSSQGEVLGQTLAQAIQSAHVCPICGHLARQKKDLKKHLRIHTGEKPYACPMCAYRSTQNSNLRTHIRRVHTQPLLQREVVISRAEGSSSGSSCPPLFVD